MSRIYHGGILAILTGIVCDIAFSIADLFLRELWALIRIPFEIIGAIFQMFATIDAMRTNLDILSSVLSIYHNFTSGLSFPENFLQSISPLGTLIWIGFWGVVFWYIGIPALGVLFSILTDHR
ncbi:hypothetical protein [Methanoregula sp.]|uniref:hypothetical protein n=1 Tax=Methanoregula sp. TaxID=2052170 RepID=UPI003C73C65B